MDACIGLARVETHSGVLEWYSTPVSELSTWIDRVDALGKRRKK